MRETNKDDAIAIALGVIGWIMSADDRAERFLSLTGIGPDDLRARITDPSLLDAGLAFLEGYQPDLIACAAALGITPETLVAARGSLHL